MGFAEKIKKIRAEKGMTQEDLAELLNVSRQSISKWESGIGYPESEKLILIAKKLEISLDYLLMDRVETREETASEIRTTSNASSGRISISTYDSKEIVSCISVRSSKVMFAGKNEPKFTLLGVANSSIWGESAQVLGWYENNEKIQMEIEDILKAIDRGEKTYQLKYYVEVADKGLSVKIVNDIKK